MGTSIISAYTKVSITKTNLMFSRNNHPELDMHYSMIYEAPKAATKNLEQHTMERRGKERRGETNSSSEVISNLHYVTTLANVKPTTIRLLA
jgi:hypothetical protein